MRPSPLHQRFTPAPLALAAAMVIALAAGHVPLARAQSAAASAATTPISVNIPEQPLGRALNELARQANLQMSFPAALVEGKRAPPVSGQLTTRQALDRLLAGSGLAANVKGSSVIVREAPAAGPADEMTLQTVQVTASPIGASNNYATGVASIARGADSLKEVPQSVTVVTSSLMEDQNLIMMGDALAKTTGIIATTDGLGNPEFRSRGFVIDNYQIDNLGTSYTSTFRPDFDLAIYDRIEVLRGADGLFSAAGEPGGTINLARKRPTDQLRSSVSMAYGNWNNRRTEGDISGPITADGRLRGRLVGVLQDRDFFYQPANERKQVVYGTLEFDLTPSTRINGGISRQHSSGNAWLNGMPTYTDGTQLGLPRHVALNVDWAHRDTTIRETFLTAEHKFNDNWSAKFSAMKQRYDFDYLQLSAYSGPVDPATGLFGAPRAFSEADGNHSDGVDLSVSGRFRAWGLDHKLIAGIDRRRSDGKQMRNRFDVNFPTGEIGMRDFPGLDLPEPTLRGYNSGWPAYGSDQQGLYSRWDLQATDRTHVILGGRLANYKHREVMEAYDESGNVIERDTSWHWRENDIFTPYAAVTYNLSPDWTAYASATEVYKPQGNIFAGPPESRTQLAPITGRNYELGAKGSVLGGTLNVAAALYHIERNGEAVKDTRYGEDSQFYLPLGKVVSQGLDLEIAGKVARGWEVFAGYTYNRNRNEKADTVYSALTPKHTFKLWTNYKLQGGASKWTVGGGMTAKSKHANTGTYWVWAGDHWEQPTFEIRQGGYSVWDAHVSYVIDARWTLALNVGNVFDKTYHSTLGVPSSGNWYGTPRNATLTLRGQF